MKKSNDYLNDHSSDYSNDYLNEDIKWLLKWLRSMIQYMIYMNELKGNGCPGITETKCEHSLTFSLQLWGRLNLLPQPVLFPEQSVPQWCPTISWHQKMSMFFFNDLIEKRIGSTGWAIEAWLWERWLHDQEQLSWLVLEQSNFAATQRDWLCFIHLHELC